MKKRGVEWSEVTCTPSALSIQIQLCFSTFLIILLIFEGCKDGKYKG